MFGETLSWSPAEWSEPSKIEHFIRTLSPRIGKAYGMSSFKFDRLNIVQRKAAGLDISKRRYNKFFRFLRRFELKLETYVREQEKYDLTRMGKSRLATLLAFEPFASDPDSAAFIAYYTARCNLRSIFTNQGQQLPYDEIADMLFQRLVHHPAQTNWWAVSYAHPVPEVLQHLSDRQRGELLGIWLTQLSRIAHLLETLWKENELNRSTMVVKKGNDSTTWNNTANAWNRARESYIALMHTLGLQLELERFCPGKVLRLIAADVAAWHRLSGKGEDPDTKVWAEIPLPWEVLSGKAECSKQVIEETCLKFGIDPVKRGWISPPPERKIERFEPTPELVHGVQVGSPELGAVLRKAGWFSGKGAHVVPSVEVSRDALGYALRADLPPIDGSPENR